MITITTKFHGPTNTLGARISCRAPGRPWRVFVSHDNGAGDIEKHARALAAFCHKHFRKHDAEPERWIAYHYGHADAGGYTFTRLLPGDKVHDCVWVHNATGAIAIADDGTRYDPND